MLLKSFLLFFFFGSSSIIVSAQDITGIWRGYFITNGSEHYKFELQIDQSKSNRISGVSYSYLDTRFYGKATLTGNFTKASQHALIQEIKTVELRMSGGSVACIMKCQFEYVKSGSEEFLEGIYTSAYEKTSKEDRVIKGGDCGGGKIFLRKVPTSDFYVESFLRDKPIAKKTSTPPSKTNNKTTAQTPVKKSPVVAQKKSTTTATTTKPPVKKETTFQKPKNNQVQTLPPAILKEEPKKIIIPRTISIPIQTRARENELAKTLTVRNEEVIVKLYDNGEIDDDTISIYLDNKLLLSSKRLSTSPITINLKMDEDNSEHVLIMVAENLGKIPPNTSLMIVNDGDKRYEVRITSTEQKNAMVRFRYQKPVP
jgi:hypothetical protein